MGRLGEQQVQSFLLADKVVTRPQRMNWQRVSQDELRAVFHVEVEGVATGSLSLMHNAAVPSGHKFKLDLDGETVLMWHFTAVGKHRNRGCPNGFPPRIEKRPHEHVWVLGRATRCARELDGVGGFSEREHLEVFCRQLHVEMRTAYVAPVIADQMVIPFEEES